MGPWNAAQACHERRRRASTRAPPVTVGTQRPIVKLLGPDPHPLPQHWGTTIAWAFRASTSPCSQPNVCPWATAMQ